MKNIIRNGYKIDLPANIEQHQLLLNQNSEISRAIHFLSSMDICETCIPSEEISSLRLGSHTYKINYRNRVISVE